MSTNSTGNRTIASDPTLSCPSTTELYPRVPEVWTSQDSQNYTDRSCSVPACNNFPSILASCCNSTEDSLVEFGTNVGPYVTCRLSDADEETDEDHESERYRVFQTCLMGNYVENFKCNNPADSFSAFDGCDGQFDTPPREPGDDEQICGIRYSTNATRAFRECCSGSGPEGAGLIPFDQGCSVACVSNSADMRECMLDSELNPTDPSLAGGISCRSGENLESEDEHEDAQSPAQSPASRSNLVAAVFGSVALVTLGALL